MKAYRKVLWLVVVLGMTVPVSAGEGKHCTAPAQDCLNYMAHSLENRGWVGLEMDGAHHESMRVTRVVDGSPAQAAGFKPGDLLVAVDGVTFSEENESRLAEIKKSMVPGSSFTYTIERKGTHQDIEVTLAPLPSRVKAQWIGQHMLEHVQDAAKSG